MALLQMLPGVTLVIHGEVLAFVDSLPLMGKGLGYVDVHLLASARLSEVPLWTLDRALDEVAVELGCGYRQG